MRKDRPVKEGKRLRVLALKYVFMHFWGYIAHFGKTSVRKDRPVKKSEGCRSFGLCGELKYVFMHF